MIRFLMTFFLFICQRCFESLFDITMGSYYGVGICELVGLYILSILRKVYKIQNVGLYRNDGLACLQKISGSALDKIQKDIARFHKIFNSNNFKVSYSCLPNFAKTIKAHNNRILSEEKTQDQPKCNCRQKEQLSS